MSNTVETREVCRFMVKSLVDIIGVDDAYILLKQVVETLPKEKKKESFILSQEEPTTPETFKRRTRVVKEVASYTRPLVKKRNLNSKKKALTLIIDILKEQQDHRFPQQHLIASCLLNNIGYGVAHSTLMDLEKQGILSFSLSNFDKQEVVVAQLNESSAH